MGSAVPTLPRSFLYVPGTKPELFPTASAGPADAVVLDLEDSVPLPEKYGARSAVRRWLEQDREPGAEQWVRINAEWVHEDLSAAVRPGLSGVFLAKCSLDAMRAVAEALETLTRERGVPAGSVRVVGLLENAQGILDLPALAREPWLTTFGIGEVDLLADLRITRSNGSAAAVDALRTQVVLHCAAAGLAAPVAPTSTDFRDLETFAQTTRILHNLGFRSRTAIHPAQVPVIHDVVTPTDEAITEAMSVVNRFEAAERGVTTDELGRLIDAAVVREARETLARSARAPR
ncbi:MAG: CoA ester lyase [Actinophytocola sp.]|nr:CoA ester lyase [Actinophytocola sp.]